MATFALPACNDVWERDCWDDEDFCCDPHLPAVIQCDLCAFGGTATGTGALEPSTGAEVCCVGGLFQYTGSTTITISNPNAMEIDTVIVMGQTAETVITPWGTSNAVCTTPCGGKITMPVVQYAPITGSEVVSSFQVTLAGGPSVGCVERVIVGKRLNLPMGLRVGAQDPWSGTGITHDVKMSECKRPMMATRCRNPVPLSLQVDCITEEFAKTNWRFFMQYAARHGLTFLPSINRCPQDVFVGWFNTPQSGTWSSPFHRQATLQGLGFIENFEK